MAYDLGMAEKSPLKSEGSPEMSANDGCIVKSAVIEHPTRIQKAFQVFYDSFPEEVPFIEYFRGY